MSNEEKILAVLQNLQADVSGLKSEVSGLKSDVSSLQTAITLTNLSIENEIKPAIQKLAEGHGLLLQKLAPKDRVEALEDDVALPKSVVKLMGQDIAELKKAQ